MTDAELHAYVDGALPPARAAAVAAEIARSPGLRALADGYAADRDALRLVFGAVAGAPVPPGLLAAAQPPPAAAAVGPAAPWRRRAVLGGGLAVAASAAAVWLAGPGGDPLVAAALRARAGEGRRPIAVADLAAALGVRVRVPDLTRAGYRLADVALAGGGGTLRFVSPGRSDFTLFLARSRGRDRFALIERQGLRVCVWENDEISAVMAADLPRAALFRLASLTYVALNG